MVAMATVWAELSMQEAGPPRSASGFKMAVRSDPALIFPAMKV